MAANGVNQSYLYNARGGYADGNTNRNRSMEQYYGGQGNPWMPMFNVNPYQGAGQQGGYNRYIPPMLTSSGWNTGNTGAGSPYSYNTPNSFGSNYLGGNGYPSPMPMWGPSFNQGNLYGGGFGGYGGGGQPQGSFGQTYPWMPQFGQESGLRPGAGGYGTAGGEDYAKPRYWEGPGNAYAGQAAAGRGGLNRAPDPSSKFPGRNSFMPGFSPGRGNGGYQTSVGRGLMPEGQTQVGSAQYSPQFNQFLNMGY